MTDIVCKACGYQKRTQEITTDKVVRYKSGKRKGEIKEVLEEKKTIYEDDPDFIHLFMEKDVDRVVYNCGDVFWPEKAEVTLLACPKCGTVIVEEFAGRSLG